MFDSARRRRLGTSQFQSTWKGGKEPPTKPSTVYTISVLDGKPSYKVLGGNVSIQSMTTWSTAYAIASTCFIHQENARSDRHSSSFSSFLHKGQSSAEPPGNHMEVDGKPEVGKDAWNDVHLVGTFHLARIMNGASDNMYWTREYSRRFNALSSCQHHSTGCR